ncbi:hypothetical protein GOODEAATRI_009793, partial [Goodea atripinnis]
CSLMGFDLNRHWQDPSPWAHPTLHAVKQLIVQMDQDPVSMLSQTHMNNFLFCAPCSFTTQLSAGSRNSSLSPYLVQHVSKICVQGLCTWEIGKASQHLQNVSYPL